MNLIGIDKLLQFLVLLKFLGLFCQGENSLDALDEIFLFEIHKNKVDSNSSQPITIMNSNHPSKRRAKGRSPLYKDNILKEELFKRESNGANAIC